MSPKIDVVRKFMDALLAISHPETDPHPLDEPCAVFSVIAGIGGPDGRLPIDAASFAITPSNARHMEDLAEAIKDSEIRCDIIFRPSDLGVAWAASDTQGTCATCDGTVTWPDDVQEALKLGGTMPDIHTAKFYFTRDGDIWFTITTDGPSTADVWIDREHLLEIAAGPAESPSPGM